MLKVNILYIAVPLVGIGLLLALRPGSPTEVSFYGFAESNETKINYNYPVVVEEILVKPGQAVKQGDILMQISRRRANETLEDQSFKMAELDAEAAIWQQKKQNQLREMKVTRDGRLAELDTRISQAEQELNFKKSLSAELKSIQPSTNSYKPLEEKLIELKLEKENLITLFELKIKGIQQELAIGNNPYRAQIDRLKAEKDFEESQKIQFIPVKAPMDGLIGNIACKEEEHISSYETLLSFYEPHSSLVKGYVHENLTLKVKTGDIFKVSSLKDVSIQYEAKVIGLGSRIIEIPLRLRKMPDIKSYGREVLLEIPKNNRFLQKEKVSLSLLSAGSNKDLAIE